MLLTSVMLNGQKQLASVCMTTVQHVWGLDPIRYCSQHVFGEPPLRDGLARGFDATLSSYQHSSEALSDGITAVTNVWPH